MVDLHIATALLAALEGDRATRVGIRRGAGQYDAVAGAGREVRAGQVAREHVVARIAAVPIGVDPAVAELTPVVAGPRSPALDLDGGQGREGAGRCRVRNGVPGGAVDQDTGRRKKAVLGLGRGHRSSGAMGPTGYSGGSGGVRR